MREQQIKKQDSISQTTILVLHPHNLVHRKSLSRSFALYRMRHKNDLCDPATLRSWSLVVYIHTYTYITKTLVCLHKFQVPRIYTLITFFLFPTASPIPNIRCYKQPSISCKDLVDRTFAASRHQVVFCKMFPVFPGFAYWYHPLRVQINQAIPYIFPFCNLIVRHQAMVRLHVSCHNCNVKETGPTECTNDSCLPKLKLESLSREPASPQQTEWWSTYFAWILDTLKHGNHFQSTGLNIRQNVPEMSYVFKEILEGGSRLHDRGIWIRSYIVFYFPHIYYLLQSTHRRVSSLWIGRCVFVFLIYTLCSYFVYNPIVYAG